MKHIHSVQLAVICLAETDTHGPKFKHEYGVRDIHGTMGVETFGADMYTSTLPFREHYSRKCLPSLAYSALLGNLRNVFLVLQPLGHDFSTS